MTQTICDHFAVRIVTRNKRAICRVEALHLLIRSEAQIYYVGLGEPPAEDKADILKQFKKYCPKCGEKIDYGPVRERLFGADFPDKCPLNKGPVTIEKK